MEDSKSIFKILVSKLTRNRTRIDGRKILEWILKKNQYGEIDRVSFG